MKARKYSYLVVLQGNYGHGHGFEDLTAAADTPEGRKAVRANRREYIANEGGVASYRIIKRRELAAQPNERREGV